MLKPQVLSRVQRHCIAAANDSISPHHALQGMNVSFPAGIKGGSYSFNIEKGPDEIFARFFGTLNPYEALQGECGCLQWAAAIACRPGSTMASQLDGRAGTHCMLAACVCTIRCFKCPVPWGLAAQYNSLIMLPPAPSKG